MFDDLFQISDLDLWGDAGDKNSLSDTSNVGRWDSSNSTAEEKCAVDDLVMPKTKPVKVKTDRPQIVVIDDDFSNIDLMKIYLQRGYDCTFFDNAREAIFYLNKSIPDLIFLDCYMSVIRAKRMVEIIKSYPEYQNVPIYFLAEEDEKGPMESKLKSGDYEGVEGLLTRPVARGALQDILDAVFHSDEAPAEKAKETEESGEIA